MILKIAPISEKSLTVYFYEEKGDMVNREVQRMAHWLRKNPFHGMVEVMASYCSLSVYYDLVKVNQHRTQHQSCYDFVVAYIKKIQGDDYSDPLLFDQKIVEIPMKYDGQDLHFVADKCELSVEELIRIHSKTEYSVVMLGFLPGFTYLGFNAPSLILPRKDTPNLHIPKGSVAIASKFCGIYPSDSPGGWYILGTTDIKLFDAKASPPSIFQVGDRLKFVPVC